MPSSHRTLREDWEFNVLGAYNYRRPGPLQPYFDYVIENHDRVPGDLLEAGVFRGRSLLGMALLLRELGSTKLVYGYDTWQGFPPILGSEDDFSRWSALLKEGRITEEHYDKVMKNRELRQLELRQTDPAKITASNVSLSGDFSGCKLEDLQAKLDFLGLDNVRLMPGAFEKTMTAEAAGPASLMAVLIDADLYHSYRVCLPYVWPRLSRGGYVCLDEYYSLKFPGARIATDEFFAGKSDRPQRHKLVEGDFERWYVRKLEA